MNPGEWAWSQEHRAVCCAVEAAEHWGQCVCRVWLPDMDAVVQVRADELLPLDVGGILSPAHIDYITAAGRVAEALTQDVLLASIGSSVIPLPHQIRALSRATGEGDVRYFLADEVGLGKTIEAGLIMRELKLRGLVKRTLVVAPRGLVKQWVAEMETHFSERFQLFLSGDFSAYRRFSEDGNLWRAYDQIVCPMDSVKPVEGRRGWSQEQLEERNRERFEDLIAAGWDLVIVDEAHRLGGTTEQVARYKLGRGLADAAPYLLLLSATPHQGKTDAFHRLVSLVDEQAFPDEESVTRERVGRYLIRTAKRQAIDAEGKPLFKPRHTQLLPVEWQEQHAQQRRLYEAVTDYVREGYNQAIREKKTYIGFLMILMQRLVTSSTRAIRTSLERRLEVLRSPGEQLMLFPVEWEEEWAELDGQEQSEAVLGTRLQALSDERAQVELLLEAARRCEGSNPDAKAEALLEFIYRLQQQEGEPDLKILVFTEFVPTQEMLREFLAARGFTVTCLNGTMDTDQRKRAQDEFAGPARIMVSTDAGGEGLNLQFCHVVVNYDIPWNPMKLEQRIGRVDRIGQAHPVRALNFVCEDTVEHRVREVLEEKLAVILEEFGVDKTGDVLDSAQAEAMFDELYVEAIRDPWSVESAVEEVVRRIREQAEAEKEASAAIPEDDPLDPAEAERMLMHPLPHWVERMVISYLQAHGGNANRTEGVWQLRWPDESAGRRVVFTVREANNEPTADHLTLEDERVRRLTEEIPRFVPGQPVPTVSLKALPLDVSGIWSLWRIGLHHAAGRSQGFLPLFLHDDGRCLQPTARRVWDELLSHTPQVTGYDTEKSSALFEQVGQLAEDNGRALYEELHQQHGDRLATERRKGERAFESRRKAMERLGLPEVRDYRLRHLEDERREWEEELETRAREVMPEIVLLILLRVQGREALGQSA